MSWQTAAWLPTLRLASKLELCKLGGDEVFAELVKAASLQLAPIIKLPLDKSLLAQLPYDKQSSPTRLGLRLEGLAALGPAGLTSMHLQVSALQLAQVHALGAALGPWLRSLQLDQAEAGTPLLHEPGTQPGRVAAALWETLPQLQVLSMSFLKPSQGSHVRATRDHTCTRTLVLVLTLVLVFTSVVTHVTHHVPAALLYHPSPKT
jgi:hypothetical protein